MHPRLLAAALTTSRPVQSAERAEQQQRERAMVEEENRRLQELWREEAEMARLRELELRGACVLEPLLTHCACARLHGPA